MLLCFTLCGTRQSKCAARGVILHGHILHIDVRHMSGNMTA